MGNITLNSFSRKLKIIDAYLTYIFFTGVFQFLYCCLVRFINAKTAKEITKDFNTRINQVGTFPFNAFLSGFISSVASFILGVCLRLQVKNLSGLSTLANVHRITNLFPLLIGVLSKSHFQVAIRCPMLRFRRCYSKSR